MAVNESNNFSNIHKGFILNFSTVPVQCSKMSGPTFEECGLGKVMNRNYSLFYPQWKYRKSRFLTDTINLSTGEKIGEIPQLQLACPSVSTESLHSKHDQKINMNGFPFCAEDLSDCCSNRHICLTAVPSDQFV